MKNRFLLTVISLLAFAGCVFATDASNLSAKDALNNLKAGNERFVKMKLQHPDESVERRHEMVKGQHPFVAVLSCSDSRVPTEIIFDQGLGDIFVIRNAGNVLDEHVLGSIEYAVEHLGVNLVVVLGHESCGAVGAAMAHSKETKAIESLKKAIEPAVELCKKQHKDSYENIIKTHAILDVQKINEDNDLSEYFKNHSVQVIPAYYHLDSGVVEFLN